MKSDNCTFNHRPQTITNDNVEIHGTSTPLEERSSSRQSNHHEAKHTHSETSKGVNSVMRFNARPNVHEILLVSVLAMLFVFLTDTRVG